MRRRSRVVRGVAAAVALLFAAAACGQHSGVYTDGLLTDDTVASLGSGTMVVVDPETGQAVTVPVAGGSSVSSAPGAMADQQLGTTASSETAVPPSHQSAVTIARATPPTGGTSVGVDDSTIKIGVHVPVTGTAPVPPNALKSLEHYWEYLCANGWLIGGRCIEIEWMDDNSTASTAANVCKEMIDKGKFMLIGFAGSHLINACARIAARAGVPYFAGGTVEKALADLPTHFAMSMPHTRQAPLIADVMVDRLEGRTERNGMVRSNIALTVEVEEALDREMAERGARFDVHALVTADYSSNTPIEIDSIVQKMRSSGVRNVYFYAGPMHFTHFVRSAAKQDYHPQMIGSGPAWAFDRLVLDAACGNDDAAHGALALNPWPAFEDRHRFDREFDRARGTSEWDWWMWGMMKTIGGLLELPGRNLTRERLLWYTARASVESGVFPPVSFSPEDHFGGESMHLLRADCTGVSPAWVTEEAFLRPR